METWTGFGYEGVNDEEFESALMVHIKAWPDANANG
jgi:hypothetical protein